MINLLLLQEIRKGIATQLLLTLDEVALKLGSNVSINSFQDISMMCCHCF